MGTELESTAIGVATGTFEIVITDEVLDDFLAGMEMDDPIFAPGGFEPGRRLAPSHLAPKLGLYPLYGDFIEKHFGGAIFAKQMFALHAPVWVGEPVSGEAKLVERYERRGKNFVVFEGRFTDRDGQLLVLERRTVMPLNQTPRAE